MRDSEMTLSLEDNDIKLQMDSIKITNKINKIGKCVSIMKTLNLKKWVCTYLHICMYV